MISHAMGEKERPEIVIHSRKSEIPDRNQWEMKSKRYIENKNSENKTNKILYKSQRTGS